MVRIRVIKRVKENTTWKACWIAFEKEHRNHVCRVKYEDDHEELKTLSCKQDHLGGGVRRPGVQNSSS